MTWYAQRYCLLCVVGWALACMLTLPAISQNYNAVSYQYYSINDGLSDRLINDIAQTKDGFIWLATTNGLNKFDGYEFIVFNNTIRNANYISDINIDQLEIDKDGNLVVVYHNNLFFFDLLDPHTHEVTKVGMLPENGVKGIVRQITISPTGEILALASNNEGVYLHQYDPEHDRFRVLFSVQTKSSRQSTYIRILPLQNGSYLLNDGQNGLRLLNHEGDVIKQFTPGDFISKDSLHYYPNETAIMYSDRQGRAWLSFRQNSGIFQYVPSLQSFYLNHKLPLLPNYAKVWEDLHGNLLFAQTNGMGVYPDVQHLFALQHDGEVGDYSYLTVLGPRIISIYGQNFSKTILLGIDTGLKITQNNVSKVENFLARPLKEDERGEIARGVTGNDTTVYFAEEGGKWFRIDLRTDEMKQLSPVDAQTGNPVEMGCTLDMLLGRDNKLWGISCNKLQEGQLHQYDLETERTKTFTYPQPIRAFTQSADGIFWLLAEPSMSEPGRLIYFDPKKEQFQTFLRREDNNPLKDAAPNYIIEAKDGTLWVGTSIGLVKIDRKTGQSVVYQTHSETNNNPLRSNIIYVIHEDDEGKLWLGTNNGVSILNPKTEDIITYNQQNGLVSNTVCGILPDEHGNYWLSTFNGLSYFDREKNLFYNFYKSDGLSHDEFNRFSFYQDKNGRYYFGGVNGVNAFYPEDLLITDTIPNVALTKMVRFNSARDSILTQFDNLSNIREIVISPYDTYFQLHFMLPEFANAKRNQFRTWLKDYEKDWTYLGSTPFIRYNSLPAGTYTLLIDGADPNGNWSANPLRVKIRVKRIFYRTWWFLSLSILLVSALAYGVFRYQWEQKLQVERFRTKLASDLHDELSGLLSGIAMQTDMLQMHSEDKDVKSRLRHIGEVSRKAMSKMSDVIWSIDSRKDRMEDLIHRMREHADDMLLPLNIKYTFEAKKIDKNHKIPPSTRQELYLIFKEAINNIVKHSNANKVDVLLSNTEGVFQMEIQDNGKGIPKKFNGKNGIHVGQGLSNIKMRAQRINAKIEILKNEGYTVKLKMRRFA